MARPVLKGFTLAEVIAASFLAFLLLGLIIAFPVPSMRAQVRGTQQVELQERAVLALGVLARDLQRSGCAGLSLRNLNPTSGDAYPTSFSQEVPVTASIIEIQSVLGDTSLDWKTRPLLYWYNRVQGRLYRQEWTDTVPPMSLTLSSAAPARLPESDLVALAASTSGTIRELVREAVWFDLSHSHGNGREDPPGPLITVSLHLVHDANVYRITRQVLLRY